MTDKEHKPIAIVDNLNNERVATKYKEQETLSDKTFLHPTLGELNRTKDVKEFIKQLKEELSKRTFSIADIEEIKFDIDKLAGDKLI